MHPVFWTIREMDATYSNCEEVQILDSFHVRDEIMMYRQLPRCFLLKTDGNAWGQRSSLVIEV